MNNYKERKYMWKWLTTAVLVALCMTSYGQKDTLMHFPFSAMKGLSVKEKISNRVYSINTAKRKAEYVKAFKGTGLRTDGYSTWISTSFINKKLPSNVSGWFALETYPTDTAGFFTLKNEHQWISACINRFGLPMIGIKEDEQIKYISADTPMPAFQWQHVSLNILPAKAELWMNGKKIIDAEIENFKTGFDSLIIGRDEAQRAIIIFPTNAINGIIDEVTVVNRSLKEKDFEGINYTAISKIKPGLDVPAARFELDFNRPKYHLLPAANWTNETHGLIYYKGRYHIFNQKDGNNLLLRQINWGHFSSPDLVSWTEHRPALSPEPGYDQYGIWSGHCIMDDEGKPIIIYTGGTDGPNGICLAYPHDDQLIEWKKFSANPVIKGAPSQFSRTDLRDPYVWKEGSQWYMIIGYGITENSVEKGAVLLYKSTNLKDWQFVHNLFVGDPLNDDSGIFWEMPVFSKMNDKYILLVNKVPQPNKPAVAFYWTGDFVNEKFIPDHALPKKLEVINRLLSPSVALDAEGRTTAIAIIPDENSAKAQYDQGWAHLYSIPRIWTLKNGTICQQPHPAMKSLRGNKKVLDKKIVSPGKPVLLSSGKHQLEIEMEITVKDAKQFGFIIGKHPQQKEMTKIFYDVERKQFVADLTKSSLNKNIPFETRTGDYLLNPGKKLTIRLFIDGSVVEVFINDEAAFTTRIFPLYKESNQVELFTEGGTVIAEKITVWEMRSAGNKTDF